MVVLTFRNAIRFFVLSFKNGNDNPLKDSFDQYYMPLVKIEDFKVSIDDKPFFDQTVKNKQEAYEKLFEISRNKDYTTGKLVGYLYHQKHQKLIIRDLSRRINTTIPQEKQCYREIVR